MNPESFLTSHGYEALILFGFLEAMCIPISSEITFGFAGVLAYQGHLNLALVIIIGSLAELGGSYTSYFVGRIGGRPLVHRVGRYVLVTESDINRAERFLTGRGIWAVPVARMLPFVRAFTSIVAGLTQMPAVRFGVLSLIGTVIYAAVLSSIGYGVGSAWQSVSHSLAIAGYIIFALVVVAIVGFIAYRWRQFRRETGHGPWARVPQTSEPEPRGSETRQPRPSGPGAPRHGRHAARPEDSVRSGNSGNTQV
ncbi:MAG: DedA family protein [Streptosporangiaceae bacterium]|nr:DedA family protein [Streptosporangiaceae bacterium]